MDGNLMSGFINFTGSRDDLAMDEAAPEFGNQYGQIDDLGTVPPLDFTWENSHLVHDLFSDPDTVGWYHTGLAHHQSSDKGPIENTETRILQFRAGFETLKKDLEAKTSGTKPRDMAEILLRGKEQIQSMEGQLSTLQKELQTVEPMEARLSSSRIELQTVKLSLTDKIAAALEDFHRNQFDKHAVGVFFPDQRARAGAHGSIAYTSPEGKTFYHDVEYFINAARAASSRIYIDVLRRNLHTCLLGGAQTWYTSVLTDREREDVTKGPGLDNWIALLRRRWTSSGDQVIVDLSNLKFSETAGRQNFTKFVTDVVHLCRRIGINMLYVQLMLAWSRMDPKLQARVGCPREEESMEDFIRKIEVISGMR